MGDKKQPSKEKAEVQKQPKAKESKSIKVEIYNRSGSIVELGFKDYLLMPYEKATLEINTNLIELLEANPKLSVRRV